MVAYNEHYQVSFRAHVMPKILNYFKTNTYSRSSGIGRPTLCIAVTMEHSKALIAALGGSSVSAAISSSEVAEWNNYLISLADKEGGASVLSHEVFMKLLTNHFETDEDQQADDNREMDNPVDTDSTSDSAVANGSSTACPPVESLVQLPNLSGDPDIQLAPAGVAGDSLVSAVDSAVPAYMLTLPGVDCSL